MRKQLNSLYYQQAQRSVTTFTEQDKAQYLAELADRQVFEEKILQEQSALYKSQNQKKVIFTVAAISILFILIVSLIFYWQTGRYQQVQQAEQAFLAFQQTRSQETKEQRNDHYIINLQNRLRKDPNNGEIWFELGQAYSLNNDFESALIAFNNSTTVLGKKPAILGAMATADYYQHKQRLSSQAQEWINEALKIDPNESASLLLLASEAFLHNDFQSAILHWKNVLENDNPAINRREIIQSIQLAEQMAKGKTK
ncbi:formate-dependent nitrite reductase complex subunit NrfG [Bisgaardia hudsonensis]|uniref:Formate-dependent nitrite reductase complex subunit NrfG n=1 Tax=Bisgaardia hudsonensis TaxID=109472 RepID=A0A4V2SJ39_9PAST|nr:tetratricopeptide repeat protein [Bisgaardia hudsonensis]QLB13479.1 cytochrome C biogenesis protein [Bisgaardia hudsonensis]TCP12888.1 formate-dependent nitrite reductase complex subunit NrfG [Bisgaardia hudsonensis]